MPTHPWLDRTRRDVHSLDMRQFIDFRQATLPNGLRIIDAHNSSGLSLALLPDRGLDIWAARYNGLPLTWISPGSPHPPDEGQSWLRQFNGGLLTTCGLAHVGPPEADAETGEARDIHGRYTRLRAGDLAVTERASGERYALELRGTVWQSGLFGEQLRLDRAYRLALGEPALSWTDRVTNCGDTPAPLMVLYHINLGYPLVRAGAVLHTPHEAVYPRDAAARAGFARWAEYDAATPGYAEQVFFHHVRGADGTSIVALLHADFGLQIAWDTRAMPYLTQWKNTRQGIYVSGIEPGNCIPEGRNAARDSGRLAWLQPGETVEFACTVTVLDGAAAVAVCRARIDSLQQGGEPVSGCDLSDYAT